MEVLGLRHREQDRMVRGLAAQSDHPNRTLGPRLRVAQHFHEVLARHVMRARRRRQQAAARKRLHRLSVQLRVQAKRLRQVLLWQMKEEQLRPEAQT